MTGIIHTNVMKANMQQIYETSVISDRVKTVPMVTPRVDSNVFLGQSKPFQC